MESELRGILSERSQGLQTRFSESTLIVYILSRMFSKSLIMGLMTYLKGKQRRKELPPLLTPLSSRVNHAL